MRMPARQARRDSRRRRKSIALPRQVGTDPHQLNVNVGACGYLA
jgi:hypothetical protein